MHYQNNEFDLNNDQQKPLISPGCNSQPEISSDKILCPVCGSDQIGFDFLSNMVCKDCGHIELGSYT